MSETRNYGMITEPDALAKLVGKLLETTGPIGFDVETGYHGPDREKGALFPQAGAFICGFSFTNDPRWARYVPVRHDFGPNMDPDVAFEIMEPLLTQEIDGSGRVVPHHEKFERRFMRREGVEIAVLTDTMIESYCLSETKTHGIKEITVDRFGHQMAEIHSLFPDIKGKAKKAIRFNVLELTPEVVAYACEDAAWAVAHTLKNRERVLAERRLPYELDMELSPVVADMEDWGVAVDWEGLRAARAEAEPFAARYEAALKDELGEWAGRDLRGMKLNSTMQLRQLLYEDLALPIVKMTNPSKTHPDGQPSTDAVALERLAKENEPIRHLLELREVNNLVKRFEKWDSYSDAEDERVHPSYGMVTVGTARFAANDPPIQQCPKDWYWSTPTTEKYPEEREWKGNFRKFLTVDADNYYLGFDYSQIELRVMAGLSGEPSLLRAFEEGEDVHTLTAAMMLGKRPEDVDPKTERPIGKTMNFALLYGMGVKSLGDRLALSRERAAELYEAYFKGFPSIRAWMDRMKAEGRVRGSTLSWINRRYTVWELTDSNPGIIAKGERVLVNAPVQGGAADYMRLAMVRAAWVLKREGLWGKYDRETGRGGVRMIMNQHDALGFEVHSSLHPLRVREIIQGAVVFPVKGFPKIESDWEIGLTWGGAMDLLVGEDGSLRTKVMVKRANGSTYDVTVPAVLAKGESWRGGLGWWMEPVREPEVGLGEEIIDPERWRKPAVVERTPARGEVVAEAPVAAREGEDTREDPEGGEASEAPSPEPAGETETVAEVRDIGTARGRLTEERDALEATDAFPGEGQEIEVRLRDFPTTEQWSRFLEEIRNRPGKNVVTVVLPEDGGTLDDLPPTSLSKADASRIALILPGAETVLGAKSVADVNLMEGMTL